MSRKKIRKIKGVSFVLLGLFIIVFHYFFTYNINESKIEELIKREVIKEIKGLKDNIEIIDKLKTKYGLVVLFKVSSNKERIGYLVLKKDGILNRYYKEDYYI